MKTFLRVLRAIAADLGLGHAHVHAAHRTDRVGTFRERTCRCGHVALDWRPHGRALAWTSGWGTRDEVTARVAAHFAEARA